MYSDLKNLFADFNRKTFSISLILFPCGQICLQLKRSNWEIKKSCPEGPKWSDDSIIISNRRTCSETPPTNFSVFT